MVTVKQIFFEDGPRFMRDLRQLRAILVRRSRVRIRATNLTIFFHCVKEISC